MLKSITIENFFGFGKPTKVEFNRRLNVLIGVNDSGKSTIARALQLLHEAAYGTAEAVIRQWGGFGTIKHNGRSKLVFEFILHEQVSYCTIEIDSISIYCKIDERVIEFIKQIAQYSIFDLTDKPSFYLSSVYDTHPCLWRSGCNLAAVLYRLGLDNLAKIEWLLQRVSPNLAGLQVKKLSVLCQLSTPKHFSRNSASTSDKSAATNYLSDGTMRMLLLLAITCNPTRGSIVCFDDPETGLHPDMISTVADTIKEAAKTSQFIVSTHSPLLLNEFDLQDVIVFEKDANYESVVKTFSDDDIPESNQMLLGQLWLAGRIGGKRW